MKQATQTLHAEIVIFIVFLVLPFCGLSFFFAIALNIYDKRNLLLELFFLFVSFLEIVLNLFGLSQNKLKFYFQFRRALKNKQKNQERERCNALLTLPSSSALIYDMKISALLMVFMLEIEKKKSCCGFLFKIVMKFLASSSRVNELLRIAW